MITFFVIVIAAFILIVIVVSRTQSHNERQTRKELSGNSRTKRFAKLSEWESERARIRSASSFKGKHYSDYVEEVKELKRRGENDKAIQLLLDLLDPVENESSMRRQPPAPGYYEELAILYRKEKDNASEVKILERYAKLSQKYGWEGKSKLLERLAKAQALANRSASNT